MTRQEPLEEQLRKIKAKDSSASRESANLDKIICVYESYLETIFGDFKRIQSLAASKEEIYKFISLLPKYDKADHFDVCTPTILSILVNKLPENKNITLDLTELTRPQSNLGSKLSSRNLVIKGNAGNFLGAEMKSGKITLEGNAGDRVGRDMKGGEIIVNGNAGENIGYGMEGGTIYLNGDYKSLSKLIEGGEIYHKGKRIYPLKCQNKNL
ncbi:hypothetical protein GOV06_01495 [Candidatus Woesearchaeota archaeon]|nr:hypothetical protein [Candidatus Woesearchaeota archaeon]